LSSHYSPSPTTWSIRSRNSTCVAAPLTALKDCESFFLDPWNNPRALQFYAVSNLADSDTSVNDSSKKQTPLRYTVRAVVNQTGDTGSFEELAMPLFARLYQFACWLTQNRTEAEDLVQEAFMKGLKSFSSYKQGTNFRAWMYRILRNTFLTSQAGLKADVSLDSEENAPLEPASLETPESTLLARMENDAIQEALTELPVHFREMILLCDFEEMSYQEISLSIGIPIGTVMSRLSRARKAMRSLLSARLLGAQQ
jgi:RNA polymerase sigma-70 factor (ECF subfamily)